ncbi:MAG TPA: Na+/H+ antiporter NhaA [Jatrophihabitantaceae bacterium]
MTAAGLSSARTAWTRNLQTPLRRFLRTETGSAAILLAATVAALVWANVDDGSYERAWQTELSIQLGNHALSQPLRGWVSTGLMTLFWFVIGLEARREFDMGELRERRRVALPVVAGLGGLAVPIVIYLIANAGGGAAHGWGAAMSTDTAFALGVLALVGRGLPGRLRSFLLTVSVVDDIVALTVIAFAYTKNLKVVPLIIGLAILLLVVVVRASRIHRGPVYALLGVAAWVAFFESGVDPVAVGMVMGLLTYANPPTRSDLERASDLFRLFREQPTPELARSARVGVASAISPNERLQQLYHPATSYVIVPLFALANAGIAIDGHFLTHAYGSAITLGIMLGYLLGKPIGITGATWLVTWASRGRLRPPVGWAAVGAVGVIGAMGFTVSLQISALAFSGSDLEEAKLGVLTAALIAAIAAGGLFRTIALLPSRVRARAVLGRSEVIVDLVADVDPDRDHYRGPVDAPVTVVEYGDFECPYCGQAEPAVRELLAGHGDVRYVWRHLPLNDVHPHAQVAATAAEAAHKQQAFWEMHDLLLTNQGALELEDLTGYAVALGLDAERFAADLGRNVGAARIAEDVDSAELSGVSGTPTFFVNGKRHQGAYDIATLTAAVRLAKTQATLKRGAPARPVPDGGRSRS